MSPQAPTEEKRGTGRGPGTAAADNLLFLNSLETSPQKRGGPLTEQSRIRGQEASPHTRGWTLGRRLPRRAVGFPAHAGMDRRHRSQCGRRSQQPRTIGDAPRRSRSTPEGRDEPRTRGNRPGEAVGERGRQVFFPAHREVQTYGVWAESTGGRFRRLRGEGPDEMGAIVKHSLGSPRTGRGRTSPRETKQSETGLTPGTRRT